jgi:mono/diheme cytochrome c family protein
VSGVLLVGLNGVLNLDEGSFTGVMPPQNRLSDEGIAGVTNYLLSVVNAQATWQPISADVAALHQSPPTVAGLRALRKQVTAT